MTFAEEIKERTSIVAKSIAELILNVELSNECYEIKIDELGSDLDNAHEDLENEKALTKKLKGLIDGGLVELVGELVEKTKETCDSMCCGYESKACMSTLCCDIDAVLTKSKESMP